MFWHTDLYKKINMDTKLGFRKRRRKLTYETTANGEDERDNGERMKR